MTQAFNLSQLGNNINSSGQVSLTAGVTGTLPIANGGTALTSAGTSGYVVTSTGSAFVMAALPASGVASLNGQTGAIDNTTQYAIGSYVLGRPQNATSYNNSTIAGSSLYAASNNSIYGVGVFESTPFSGWATDSVFWGGTNVSGYPITPSTSFVNTGSWRCVSIAGVSYIGSPATNGANTGHSGLWVRYA
jgi:hypothetical protein